MMKKNYLLILILVTILIISVPVLAESNTEDKIIELIEKQKHLDSELKTLKKQIENDQENLYNIIGQEKQQSRVKYSGEYEIDIEKVYVKGLGPFLENPFDPKSDEYEKENTFTHEIENVIEINTENLSINFDIDAFSWDGYRDDFLGSDIIDTPLKIEQLEGVIESDNLKINLGHNQEYKLTPYMYGQDEEYNGIKMEYNDDKYSLFRFGTSDNSYMTFSMKKELNSLSNSKFYLGIPDLINKTDYIVGLENNVDVDGFKVTPRVAYQSTDGKGNKHLGVNIKKSTKNLLFNANYTNTDDDFNGFRADDVIKTGYDLRLQGNYYQSQVFLDWRYSNRERKRRGWGLEIQENGLNAYFDHDQAIAENEEESTRILYGVNYYNNIGKYFNVKAGYDYFQYEDDPLNVYVDDEGNPLQKEEYFYTRLSRKLWSPNLYGRVKFVYGTDKHTVAGFNPKYYLDYYHHLGNLTLGYEQIDEISLMDINFNPYNMYGIKIDPVISYEYKNEEGGLNNYKLALEADRNLTGKANLLYKLTYESREFNRDMMVQCGLLNKHELTLEYDLLDNITADIEYKFMTFDSEVDPRDYLVRSLKSYISIDF